MIEVEMKAKIDDSAKVTSKLLEHRCVYVDTRIQRDTYYNRNDRDFAITDEALRIRENGEKSVITYKGPKIDNRSKSRTEIELIIDDPAAAGEILTALGCVEVSTVTKTRHNYRFSRYTISIDNVSGLGDYLEIETSASYEHEVPSKVDEMIRLLNDFGIRQEATITQSYLEMLLEKRGR